MPNKAIELKEKQSLEFLIENEWNFKPLFSHSEKIDFPKVQQFEQHTFEIYKSIVDSFAKYKSKLAWCQKAMEEIKMQEECAKIITSHVSGLNKLKNDGNIGELLAKFRASVKYEHFLSIILISSTSEFSIFNFRFIYRS